MGNGALSFKRKKAEPPPRRDPLSKAEEIWSNAEAQTIVSDAIKAVPPGTPRRWQRLLQTINKDTPPTEEVPDPLRINIDIIQLRAYLRQGYNRVTTISSDNLALMREYLPRLYDKHSVERGKRVSQKEREAKGLRDEGLAYGELDFDIFATIYLRATQVYGVKQQGVFYDLGCGVGTLVYASAVIGNFRTVVGIETISALLERGDRRMDRWESMTSELSAQIRDVSIQWIEDDFVLSDFWSSDATFILLHWTALTRAQKSKVVLALQGCPEGTHVVTFTTSIGHPSLAMQRGQKEQKVAQMGNMTSISTTTTTVGGGGSRGGSGVSEMKEGGNETGGDLSHNPDPAGVSNSGRTDYDNNPADLPPPPRRRPQQQQLTVTEELRLKQQQEQLQQGDMGLGGIQRNAPSGGVSGSGLFGFEGPGGDEANGFVLLLQDSCRTSWGTAEFFFHEKITSPKTRGQR